VVAQAPNPPDEAERLAALEALGILDTPPEARFDRVTRLAKRLFAVEISLVTLVDANRQWYKSCIGLAERESPRAVSFCAHAILSDEILVIPDARADPRVADNSNVTGEPRIRFYAGKPIRAPSGHRIGTLCVVDKRPREFGSEDRTALGDLAALVEDELRAGHVTEVALQLQRAEASLRAVMSGAAEGIATLDREGVVTFINPAAAASLGYEPAELMGCSLHQMVHHSRADGSPYPIEDCPMHATLAGGPGVRNSEEVFWRKDGNWLPIEYTCTGIRENGMITGAVATWSDITERRELERMKDEFISSVSHELRTPLTSIKGYVEALLAGDAGGFGVDQRAFLEVIDRNADKLHSLISDLLLLARLRSHREDPVSDPVEIIPLVESVLEELWPAATAKGIELEREVAGGAVRGDERQLGQALANLVGNAIKFTPGAGTVRICSEEREGSVIISVSDQGVGIPAEDLSRLGTRFFRARTAEGTEGTGLGLAITREIVASHGGSFECESEPGKSSTFPFATAPRRLRRGVRRGSAERRP
jgi:PAS domain S-box-containing protein